MYVIMQTKFKAEQHNPNNYNLGIASKNKHYRNLSGPIESIKFEHLAIPLKELHKSEFEELNIGFYLILE